MLSIAGVLEMLMVVCFGISWPINISKAWNARTAKETRPARGGESRTGSYDKGSMRLSIMQLCN